IYFFYTENLSRLTIFGCNLISVFIELVTKQFSLDFSNTLFAFSASLVGLTNFKRGKISASVIKNFRSGRSNLIRVVHSKLSNSNFEFSAIAKKVVIKQLLIAAA